MRDLDVDSCRIRFGLAGRAAAHSFEQPRIQRAELELGEQDPRFLAVERGRNQVVDVERDVAVETEAGHLPVLEDPVTHLPEVRPLLRREVVEVFEDAFEAAVGVDELRGSLLADAGNAGEVVARVAAHRRVVGVLRGRDSGAFLDPGFVVQRVVGDAALVVEHLEVRVLHELVRVAIAGDDDGVDPLRRGARRQGADHVVGFDSFELDRGDPQRLEHLADQR